MGVKGLWSLLNPVSRPVQYVASTHATLATIMKIPSADNQDREYGGKENGYR
jgi:hypothetical protein